MFIDQPTAPLTCTLLWTAIALCGCGGQDDKIGAEVCPSSQGHGGLGGEAGHCASAAAGAGNTGGTASGGAGGEATGSSGGPSAGCGHQGEACCLDVALNHYCLQGFVCGSDSANPKCDRPSL